MPETTPSGLCRRHYRLEVKDQTLENFNPRIPVSELRTLDEARRVVERVEAEARTTLEKADRDAEKLRQQAREEATRNVLREASNLLQQLNETNRQRRESVAELAAAVAGSALERLAGEIPESQRIRAVVGELLTQAGKEAEGVLLVHPDDEPHLPDTLGDGPWTVRTSEQQEPGTCRLTTPHGRYETGFEARLATLAGRIRHSVTSTASQTGTTTGNPATTASTQTGAQ